MSSRLLAAVAASEKRKENKEGERRKDGETSPEQREATVSNTVILAVCSEVRCLFNQVSKRTTFLHMHIDKGADKEVVI